MRRVNLFKWFDHAPMVIGALIVFSAISAIVGLFTPRDEGIDPSQCIETDLYYYDEYNDLKPVLQCGGQP